MRFTQVGGHVRHPTSPQDFIVTPEGVAAGCGVAPHTPSIWRNRRLLPPVDVPEAVTPLWWESTIAGWAAATDRRWDREAARREMRAVGEMATRAGALDGGFVMAGEVLVEAPEPDTAPVLPPAQFSHAAA